MPASTGGGVAFRIRKHQFIALGVNALVSGFSVRGQAIVQYDDGSWDIFQFPETALTAQGALAIASTSRADKDGWVYQLWVATNNSTGPNNPPIGGVYVEAYLTRNNDITDPTEVIASGWIFGGYSQILGRQDSLDFSPLWIFQGTVASDATVGTHVCTLTVTPGAGNQAELLYGQMILTGAAGLVATVAIQYTGGFTITNLISDTAAKTYNFPFAPTGSGVPVAAGQRFIFSGAMSLVLTATTSTVSSTQTFACALRLKSAAGLPTATLADNTGTPVLTTNASGVV